MRVTAATILISAIAATGTALATPAFAAPATETSATSVSATSSSTLRPKAFTSVRSQAGPGPGQVTFRWEHDSRGTTGYVLETALTQFSKSATSSLPRTGRNARLWAISPQARSFTMSAAQLAAAGAPVGSGNHLYFRLYARNAAGLGIAAERAYPYLGAVMPYAVPAASATATTELRVGSFNVRTARATTDSRSWLQRRSAVAAAILDRAPAVTALQELGPGRADGLKISLNGTPRQTESLLSALAAQGGEEYKLVRTTAYAAPGSPSGTQGARLLYDSSRVELLSECAEKTGKSNYSADCSVKLPLLDSDAETERRRAAFAEFRDRSSGKRFFVVSLHLDTRHGKTAAEEKVFNKLRADQTKKALAAVAEVNPADRPVVVAGDLNSWQNIAVGNGPADTLVGEGYNDTVAAKEAVNLKYATLNSYAVDQKVYAMGFGTRLDVIMTKGFAGTTRHENVTKATDSARPSDHNLVVADTVL